MLTTAPFSRSHCGLALPESYKCTDIVLLHPSPCGIRLCFPTLTQSADWVIIESELVLSGRGTVECTYSCRSPMGSQCEVETGQPAMQGCLMSVSEPGPLRGRCISAPRSSLGCVALHACYWGSGPLLLYKQMGFGAQMIRRKGSGCFPTCSLAAKCTPTPRGLNLTWTGCQLPEECFFTDNALLDHLSPCLSPDGPAPCLWLGLGK